MLYDDNNLYVLFICDEPGQVKAEKRPVDSVAIFEDDSVEVFIDVGDGSTYRHFGVNAAGSFYDEKGRDASWNSNTRVWTGKTPAGWWAVFAIPLNELTDAPPGPDTVIPPRAGTLWRGNFCRTQPAQVPPERYTSWSPTNGSFHRRDKFGTMQFTKNINLINTSGFELGLQGWFIGGKGGWIVSRLDLGSQDKMVFHGGQMSWRMGRGYLSTNIEGIDPSQTYRFSVWIKTKDVPDDSVQIWVDLWEGKRYLKPFLKRPVTGGTHDWQQFGVDINNLDSRTSKLQVFLRLESDTGTVWFDDARLEPTGQ